MNTTACNFWWTWATSTSKRKWRFPCKLANWWANCMRKFSSNTPHRPGSPAQPKYAVCAAGILPVCRRCRYLWWAQQISRLSQGLYGQGCAQGADRAIQSAEYQTGGSRPLYRRPGFFPLCERRTVCRGNITIPCFTEEAGWYFKASQLMQNTSIRTAFVSTNSITQGEHVASMWKPLYDRFGIHIDFAHRTFHWDSEASLKAHVHCVIMGFSIAPNQRPKYLFNSDVMQIVNNINAYLIDVPEIFIESRKHPLCNFPEIVKGSSPVDGGNLLLNNDEYKKLLKKNPKRKNILKNSIVQKSTCIILKDIACGLKE